MQTQVRLPQLLPPEPQPLWRVLHVLQPRHQQLGLLHCPRVCSLLRRTLESC